MANEALQSSNLGNIEFFKKGKVREIYNLDDKYLMIATDRISCFDVVLPTLIPQKGAVLTTLSVFWFGFTTDIIPNHFISANTNDYPTELQQYKETLQGRSMLVKKANPLPVECVVRGYLSGSGWKEYQQTQSICGIKLPAGLKESNKLPEPIFTPSTKEDAGHDINISQEYVEKKLGKELADKIKNTSLALYKKASDFALSKGIIIADTKFEFGKFGDELILIDEVLTPDSSRFWPESEYAPGRPQSSFDKQFARDYLETLDWDKTYPGPKLPDSIVSQTTQKYIQALKLITGEGLSSSH